MRPEDDLGRSGQTLMRTCIAVRPPCPSVYLAQSMLLGWLLRHVFAFLLLFYGQAAPLRSCHRQDVLLGRYPSSTWPKHALVSSSLETYGLFIKWRSVTTMPPTSCAVRQLRTRARDEIRGFSAMGPFESACGHICTRRGAHILELITGDFWVWSARTCASACLVEQRNLHACLHKVFCVTSAVQPGGPSIHTLAHGNCGSTCRVKASRCVGDLTALFALANAGPNAGWPRQQSLGI